jgi:peroxiredoxin
MIFAGLVLLLIQPCFCGADIKAQDMAVDFSVTGLDNSKVSLADLKDKNAILFFWTTWCPYCRQELGVIKEHYTSLQKDGVEVLPIDIGESRAKVENFLKNRNFGFKFFLDENSSVAKEYEVLGIPTYVLIDKKGVIRYRGHSFPDSEYRELSQG